MRDVKVSRANSLPICMLKVRLGCLCTTLCVFLFCFLSFKICCCLCGRLKKIYKKNSYNIVLPIFSWICECKFVLLVSINTIILEDVAYILFIEVKLFLNAFSCRHALSQISKPQIAMQMHEQGVGVEL